MILSNLTIVPEVYGEILQECVNEKNLSLGRQIHALIAKNGSYYAKNSYIETKLVVFYSKCGSSADAEGCFGRLKAKNPYSFAAIIGARVKQKRNVEALQGFCEMLGNGIVADNYVLPTVLNACAALQLSWCGRAGHGHALKLGYAGCLFVCSSLLDMYCKCGFLCDARKVFDKMPDRNAVLWNAMIAGYVQNGFDREAARTFHDMRREGVEPTRASLLCFLTACCSLGAIEEGKQGHALTILLGLELDSLLGSSVLNFYSKAGLVEDARLAFCLTNERDTVNWNLLLSCYNQCEKYGTTLAACRLMSREKVSFDSVTVACLLLAASATENLRLGREVHGFSVRSHLVHDALVASRLAGMYAACGRVDHAN